MPKVPVFQRDKEKSYYKYFTRPMAAPAPGRIESITDQPADPAKALRIQDRNRLFEAGSLEQEFGWWQLEDGTAMLANQTFMPGVTGEMFDWWFAWHPIDRLRYGIWDPEDHFDVYLADPARALDFSLTMQQRHWGSTHYVWEDIGMGGIDILQINFRRPGELGYDESKIGTDACNALICANCTSCGAADRPDMPVVMTHFLRPAEGGSELRSRFWFGWQIIDGTPVKMIPDGVKIPAVVPISLLKHNVVEFTNLAAILPEVYAEEKDNWT
ncbi:phloretin hydrolase [Ruminococcaceae bacterium OttesenSCG-928-D13]|nr:phloretin hydrolase [Ruminococcaceae bacterium OttesenSCG-928-D13]